MKIIQHYLLLVLRGCAMGMADVIPGVSGGTIAFITGIYEELLNSIRQVNITALRLLFTLRLKAFWQHINGSFLLAVVGGIGISIFSFARLMKYLLATYPIPVWSFFFGLIIASVWLMGKDISWRRVSPWITLAIGAAAAYVITVLTPASTPESWWFVILSGAIAICAMILPGISGAFILLLMGKYEYIISAVSELNIPVMGLFVVGAVAGIIAFSHFLSWLLKRYHGQTIALLTGFMLGSLNKIWPWKTEQLVDGIPFPVEQNVWPATLEATGTDPHLGVALGMMVLGFGLIWGLERVAGALKKNH